MVGLSNLIFIPWHDSKLTHYHVRIVTPTPLVSLKISGNLLGEMDGHIMIISEIDIDQYDKNFLLNYYFETTN